MHFIREDEKLKENNKIGFCFLCCFLSFVLSLVSLMTTSLDVQEVKQENEYLSTMVSIQSKRIDTQNDTIDKYKNYVDGVSKCIVEGIW